MGERGQGDIEPRWVGRRFSAAAIRVAVVLVPIAAGITAGIALARGLPRPSGIAVALWILAILVASSVTTTLIERVARRLLPLATLLRLSLVFPDRVPSRFKLARQAGNIRVLQRRALEARESGLDHDPGRAAETILSLVAALSAHDRKTRGHSERVRAFTDMIAEEFDLPTPDRDRLRWAALVHDIGKLEVPSKTLNKPGKPDAAEWERIRSHPIEGERIAAPLLPWLGEWAGVIGQHHERWDGAGYPRGLSGHEIGLGARIASVADSFEVMTAARSYKRPMTPNAARRELQRCAGDQFDPQVVRAFLSISLGRLWWAVGPASWVAQVPMILGIGRTGGQAVTLARAAGAIAINGLAGIVALGVGTMITAQASEVGATPAVHAVGTVGSTSPTESVSGGSGSASDEVTESQADPPAEEGSSSEDGLEAPGPAPGEADPTTDPVSDPVVDEELDTVDDVVEGVEDTVDDAVQGVEDTVDEVVGGVEDTVDDVEDVVDDVLGGLG